MCGRFYVYLLKRSYENSFYVGKGCEGRYLDSMRERHCDLALFVHVAENEMEAFRLEDKVWIEMTRRDYKMINLRRPGRYGLFNERSGNCCSEATREIIRQTQLLVQKRIQNKPDVKAKRLEFWSRAEILIRHSEIVKKAISTPEVKSRHRVAIRSAYQSVELRSRMREIGLENNSSIESREHQRRINLGRKHSLETREKIRKARLERG